MEAFGPVLIAGAIGVACLLAYREIREVYSQSRSMSPEERAAYRRQLAPFLFAWAATIRVPTWLAIIGNLLAVVAILFILGVTLIVLTAFFLGWFD